METVSQDKLRAWWSHRQGLDSSFFGKSPQEVLERSGWARSVGGVGPYLTLFGRSGTSRTEADSAVQNLDIHELPAARGCTYVVPATHFALALRVGQSFADGEMKTARKLGVTDDEITKLCEAVMAALAKGPLDPEAIREATGSASRKLGEEGKKKGLTTTLPLTLGKLQASGEIRRISANGRLDQQRYAYALWQKNPLAEQELSDEEANVELARQYFSWIGPASLGEFRWFSALSVKVSEAAIAPLKLVRVDNDRLMIPKLREQFEEFQVPKQPHYVLVSSLDGISLLRRDLKSLIDPRDLDRRFVTDKEAAALNDLADLPSHAIFDRGRLVGLWEYDTTSDSIVAATFIPRNDDLKSAIARTEDYIRKQLGDARSFSLDSPKSRAPRIEGLRKASPSRG